MYNDILYDLARFHAPEARSCFDARRNKYVDPNVDRILDSMSSPSLIISIDATFSGVFTNRRTYPGKAMRKATSTWTQHYGKPVLPQHPQRGLFSSAAEDKPVGRVVDAKYIRTVAGKEFDTDYRAPQPYGSAGSGFIKLDAQVSGRENVDMVLSNRWKTTSVGFVPSAAFCSVCAQNWKTKGPCDHEPGNVYEIKDEESGRKSKSLAYLIVPPGNYDHIAFVNTPAQGLSGVSDIGEVADSADQAPWGIPPTEFVITDSEGGLVMFYEDETKSSQKPEPRSFVSLPSEFGGTASGAQNSDGDSSPAQTVEDHRTMAKELLDRLAAIVADCLEQEVESDGVKELSTHILGFIQKDESEELADDIKVEALTDEELDGVVASFFDAFLVDAKKDPKDRPGGSNAGKYSKSDGPFCGPSGDAPAGTYPIGTLKRAKAALAYARNAPNPKGIKDCVCNKWGSQLPSCGAKKDEAEGGAATPDEDGFFLKEFGDAEKADAAKVLELKDQLPHQDDILSDEERMKVDPLDFAGPDRTYLAGSKEQVENSTKMLELMKDELEDEVRTRIQECLNKRAELFNASPPESDSSDEGQEDASGESDASTDVGENDKVVIDTLASKVRSLEQQLKNIGDTMKDREGEIRRLRTQSLSDKQANRNLLVDRVIDLKLALKKPDVAEAKTEQDLRDIKDRLSSRSPESLLDAISDLRMELMNLAGLEKVSNKVKDDKLEDETPKSGQPETKPPVRVSSKAKAKAAFRK